MNKQMKSTVKVLLQLGWEKELNTALANKPAQVLVNQLIKYELETGNTKTKQDVSGHIYLFLYSVSRRSCSFTSGTILPCCLHFSRPYSGLKKKSHFNTLDFPFHPDNYTIIPLHSKKIHPGVIGMLCGGSYPESTAVRVWGNKSR